MENNKDKEEESEGKDPVEEVKSSKGISKDVSRVSKVTPEQTPTKSPAKSTSVSEVSETITVYNTRVSSPLFVKILE